MCNTKQEVTDIINTALAQHELGDIQRYVQLEDKMDKTLVSVRESIPPSFSPYLNNFQQTMEDLKKQIESLREEVRPVVSVVDTAKNLRTGTIWIAGFLLALYPIVEGFRYIKRLLN